jgi:hypothetical protein
MKTAGQQKTQADKQYQFAKLCMALTRQGFKFVKQRGLYYALTFDKVSAKRLFHPDTRTPFVDSWLRNAGDRTKECYIPKQWADRGN